MKHGTWLLLSAVVVASSPSPAWAQDAPKPDKSHAVMKGTLIGLAAGVAGGALFFAGTNCHYGSDSGAAMFGCGVVTGGIIAAGGIVGHKIGHRIAKRAATRTANTSAVRPWYPPQAAYLATGRSYAGPYQPEGFDLEGRTKPVVNFVPSISTTGMTFYTGDRFPQWKSSLFVGGVR